MNQVEIIYLHGYTEAKAAATVQKNPKSKGKPKEFATLLLSLPAQKSFIQRKWIITELKVFAFTA